VGLEQQEVSEVLGGLTENEQVITTGSAALRDGDRIVLSGQGGSETPQGEAGRGTPPDGSGRATASDESGGDTPPGRAGRGGGRRGGSDPGQAPDRQ
jgi:hypothetical protein